MDPRYGNAQEFDGLLNDAHARDMPVMLDMVVNHAGYGAKFLAEHPDWFTDPSTCGQQGDPDIFCELAGLPDFDHRKPVVRDYLVDAHLQWVSRFPFDAIGMDTVKHVTPEYFEKWIGAIRQAKPGMFVIGELLDEHSFDRFARYLDAGFNGLFHFPLRRGLIDTFAAGHSVDIVANRMQETLNRFGFDRTSQMVNLLDNHDVPRFLEEIPKSVPGKEAQERYRLTLTALFPLHGIPQIYYGNEIGMYGGRDPANRRFMPDWAFSETGRQGSFPGFLPSPNEVHSHVQTLLTIRKRTPALQDGTYSELWRQSGPANNNVWAYLREKSGQAVVVAYNNGYLPTTGTIPLNVGAQFSDGTVLTDVLGSDGSGYTVENGHIPLYLEGRQSVILVPDTSPDPIDEMVDIRFEVSASTEWGQNVFIAGNTPALGNWDLNGARRLTASNCSGSLCTWHINLSVPLATPFDFKFMKINETLDVHWEAGANRQHTPLTSTTLDAGAFRTNP